MIVSVTELKSFNKCRRAWHLRHVDKLILKDGGVYSRFWVGSAVHKGLEYYYSNPVRTLENLLKGFEDYLQEHPYDNETDIALCRNMLEAYFYYDVTKPYWKTTLVEKDLIVSIPGTNSFLSGKPDAIAEINGKTFLIDHKTSSGNLDVNALSVDLQPTGYLYLFYRKYNTILDGIIYNVVSKRNIQPPAELKNGSLSKSKSQMTSYETYLKALAEKGLSQDDYADILSYFKEEKPFVVRLASTRTLRELQNFERDLIEQTRQMERVAKNPRFAIPSPDIYSCSGCQFLAICKGLNDGSDIQKIMENNYQRMEKIK